MQGGLWISDVTARPEDTENRVDIKYISDLLDLIEEEHCINTSQIYVAGMGQGGGMAHLLACDPEMSRRIAAFVAVEGAFYSDTDEKSPWFECKMGRRPIPFLEIHGNSNEKWPYWPPKVEGAEGPQQVGPALWIMEWAKWNNCGKKVGEPKVASFSNGTVITELRNGILSEGVEYKGGAVRVAYSCSAKEGDRIKETDSQERRDLRDMADLTLLHYSLKDEEYNWARKNLKEEKRIKVNNIDVVPPGNLYFDATDLMFRWFVTHPLPPKDEIERQAKEMEEESSKKTAEKDEL
jgi:hypothetical protein